MHCEHAFMLPFGVEGLVSVHLPGIYMYSVWFCVVVLSANTTKVLVWLGRGGVTWVSAKQTTTQMMETERYGQATAPALHNQDAQKGDWIPVNFQKYSYK